MSSKPVFEAADFKKQPGEEVEKVDVASGRAITHTFQRPGGHFLTVFGHGVPGQVTVSCDGEHVNMIARVLLDARFDVALKL